VTAKKSPKIFRDFWQLSTLIANISGTDQHIKNRKSSWSSATPPTLGEKNLAYFGPQTKKLLTLINVHPNGIFSGNCISALRGCCAMKFLYALQIDQGYLAHTPTGTAVPPKKFQSWKLKIWPKIQRVRLNNFRASGSILTGLFSVDAPQCKGDKLGTSFTMPAPKNLWQPKNRPKFFAIFDNFRLWSLISPEPINISKIGKALDHLQPLSR